jgi:hypothetical protein
MGLRIIVVVLLANVFIWWALISALAHGWYEYRCCSDKDCRALEAHEIRVAPEGFYVTPDGGPTQFVPMGNHRLREIPAAASAEDIQKFHLCTVQGKPTGEILCLYVPQGGS